MIHRPSTRRGLVSGTLVTLLLLTALPLGAQGRGRGSRFGGHPGAGHPGAGLLAHLADHLELTDEQRQRIQGIFESYQPQLEEGRSAIADARQAIAELSRADSLDEAAIRAAAADLGAAEGEAAILHARMRQEVHAVLTPAQLAELEDFRPRRRGFGHGGHHGPPGFAGPWGDASPEG